jgi:predicted transcriptional regulator
MPSVREQVIQVLNALPDDATLDDVMAELHFRMRLEQGLNDLDQGRWITQEQVEKRMAKWLDPIE